MYLDNNKFFASGSGINISGTSSLSGISNQVEHILMVVDMESYGRVNNCVRQPTYDI